MEQDSQPTLFDPPLKNPLREFRDDSVRVTDPETSAKTSQNWKFPRRKSQCFQLAEFFYRNPGGHTSDAAWRAIGLDGACCPWHRISDLKKDGFLTPTGETRLTLLGSEADGPGNVRASADRLEILSRIGSQSR